jgi:hypothetical protein
VIELLGITILHGVRYRLKHRYVVYCHVCVMRLSEGEHEGKGENGTALEKVTMFYQN